MALGALKFNSMALLKQICDVTKAAAAADGNSLVIRPVNKLIKAH